MTTRKSNFTECPDFLVESACIDKALPIWYNILVVKTTEIQRFWRTDSFAPLRERHKKMEHRFETFTVLMASINRCIRKIKSEEMAGFDLKSPHVSCLYYLHKTESLTARELCDVCEEDKANISRSIKYLEENGYLVCHSRMQKRYQSPLTLTEKGREVGKYITERIDSVLKEASAGLSEEHRVILYQSLALINDNLQRLCGEYEGK